jgi:hypothetical protein
LPFADGYEGFWKNPISIQHPLAEIEVAPYDGSYYVVISKDDRVAEKLMTAFPSAEDLEEHNKKHTDAC